MNLPMGCKSHRDGDGSWWESDAAGIPMFRCCDKCRVAKLRGRVPECLDEEQREAAGYSGPVQGYAEYLADCGERLDPED